MNRTKYLRLTPKFIQLEFGNTSFSSFYIKKTVSVELQKFKTRLLNNSSNQSVALVKTPPQQTDLQLKTNKITDATQLVDLPITTDTKCHHFLIYFFSILGKTLDVRFESQHVVFMNEAIVQFIHKNPSVASNIAFDPNDYKGFTRNFARFQKQIKTEILQNKRSVSYFGQKMLICDFYDVLTQKINSEKSYYYYMFLAYTLCNRVRGFHLLHPDVLWYMDITEVGELGKGKHDKNSGPQLLFIMDCSTKQVIYQNLFPSKEEYHKTNHSGITTQVLLNEVFKAVKKSKRKPFFLHTDSDPKNISMEYITGVLQMEITPTFNKSPWGYISNLHGNQVIENLNLHFKRYLDKKLKDNLIPEGGLSLASLATKSWWIKETLKDYHDKGPHGGLSTIRFNPRHGLEITPNMAIKSHGFFNTLFLYFLAMNKQQFILPSKIVMLKNRDPNNIQDQNAFVEYVVKSIICFSFSDVEIHDLYNLITFNKSGGINAKTQVKFFKTVSMFFAYFLAHSINPRMYRFFREGFPYEMIGTPGPGRDNNYTQEYVHLQRTKEEFTKYYDLFHQQFLIQIITQIHNLYLLISNNLTARAIFDKTDSQTQAIFDKTDSQTQILINNANAQTEKILQMQQGHSSAVKKLNTQLDDVQAQLQIFYAREEHLKLLKEKKKNRLKRPITPAIKLDYFLKALELLSPNQNKTQAFSKQFVNARNRLAIFLLWFTGMRVGTLLNINFFNLADIFKENSKALIPVSKTRDRKEEQIFVVTKSIRQKFIFGDINLFSDYELLINHFDQWADQNNISKSERYNYSFFSTAENLSKPVSRVYLTNTINNIVRKAVDATSPGSRVKPYTSHSFRIHLITRIIDQFGLRVAQQFVKHQSPNTTAIYDRNELKLQQLKNISEALAFGKTVEQLHPDSSHFNSNELDCVANVLANNENLDNFSIDPHRPMESLKEQLLPNFSFDDSYLSLGAAEERDHSLIKEKWQEDQLASVQIKTNQANAYKKFTEVKKIKAENKPKDTDEKKAKKKAKKAERIKNLLDQP